MSFVSQVVVLVGLLPGILVSNYKWISAFLSLVLLDLLLVY